MQGAFTGHVALFLSMRAPSSLTLLLMSAPIISLGKSREGVRPVAMERFGYV